MFANPFLVLLTTLSAVPAPWCVSALPVLPSNTTSNISAPTPPSPKGNLPSPHPPVPNKTTTTAAANPNPNLAALAAGLSSLMPASDGTLELDSDSGGESAMGNTANSVANGYLGQGGAGSASLNAASSGSSTVFCKKGLFSCASAAQSNGNAEAEARGGEVTIGDGGTLAITLNIGSTVTNNNNEDLNNNTLGSVMEGGGEEEVK